MEPKDKANLLKELGLEKVSEKILRKTDGKRKLLTAVDGYKYATQEDLDSFNAEMKSFGKRLAMKELKDYENLPPDDVLESLKQAKDKNCFDKFMVAYIEMVKDPILFGKIDGFDNIYFYIAQWGDDVKIEDIIKF